MSGKHASIAFLLSVAAMAGLAQSKGELSENSFVSAFKVEKPQTIHSFLLETKDSQTLSSAERSILRWVSDTGKDTESIRKAGEIIDSNQLRSMDIEMKFKSGSEEISPEVLGAMDALGNALQDKDLASVEILVNGHTDAKGDPVYNLTLSKARAEAVRSRLILDYGIAPSRIIAIGFGEQRLRDLSDSEPTTNRRVEIISIGAEHLAEASAE